MSDSGRVPPWQQPYKMHLTLKEYVADAVTHKLLAGITLQGDLIIYGHDSGDFVVKFWSNQHYYWWLTIRAEYKDLALLTILKALALDENKLKDHLNEQAVPYEFSGWPTNVKFSDPT